MKHLLLLAVTLIVAAISGYAQEGFRISGRVTNMPDGTIWLLGRTNPNALDTLGKAELKAGVFELNGQVRIGCLALIVMTDRETGFQLMLDCRKAASDGKSGSIGSISRTDGVVAK